MTSIRSGLRLEKPTHCKRELYNVMYYCWNQDPVDRPSFSELVKILANLIEESEDYIRLDLFPEHCYYNLVEGDLEAEKV